MIFLSFLLIRLTIGNSSKIRHPLRSFCIETITFMRKLRFLFV